MQIFTIKNNSRNSGTTYIPKQHRFLPIVLFWLLIWQFASMLIQNRILFASPLETIQALLLLVQTGTFWQSVFSSFCRIAVGFFLAVTAGTLLAAVSACSDVLRLFLSVPIQFMKTVPVVSFIILALLWIPSEYLSVLISFLMVLPVMYTNIQKGIDQTETALLEMACVYRIGFLKTLRYIYLPAVLPFFMSACSIGLGFCFKSGIAAEVIGLPSHSIGEALYQSKLYLLTADVFAWTFVIIGISLCFEKSVLYSLKRLQQRLQKPSALLPIPWTGAPAETKPVQKQAAFHTQPPCLIRLEQIKKQFGTQIILKEFSLWIRPAERIACMGPSGIGKTTVFRLLLGLLAPDTGTIFRADGLSMAAVFQENRLCMETDAINNVLFTAFPNAKTKEEKQLAITKIHALFARMELTDCEGKRISELSGGMQRRVALARALLTPSDVLLLDEPFKGLDPALKEKIMQLTEELLCGRAVFLITHDPTEAAFFQCHILML